MWRKHNGCDYGRRGQYEFERRGRARGRGAVATALGSINLSRSGEASFGGDQPIAPSLTVQSLLER